MQDPRQNGGVHQGKDITEQADQKVSEKDTKDWGVSAESSGTTLET